MWIDSIIKSWVKIFWHLFIIILSRFDRFWYISCSFNFLCLYSSRIKAHLNFFLIIFSRFNHFRDISSSFDNFLTNSDIIYLSIFTEVIFLSYWWWLNLLALQIFLTGKNTVRDLYSFLTDFLEFKE